MAKRGPKMIEIDWIAFDKLCAMQCTLNEIAAWFDCSIDTIEGRCKKIKGMKFSDYYRQKKEKGLISLRRAQWQGAVEGKNTALLIFLGKQYLGQSDKVVHAGDTESPLTLAYAKNNKTGS
jgi:hypothetical protein